MSKITNDDFTRSGTGCFIAVYPCGNSRRQRVKVASRRQQSRAVARLYHTDNFALHACGMREQGSLGSYLEPR